MARDATRAAQLKEEGNSHFKKEDYIGAESLYSKAYVFVFPWQNLGLSVCLSEVSPRLILCHGHVALLPTTRTRPCTRTGQWPG